MWKIAVSNAALQSIVLKTKKKIKKKTQKNFPDQKRNSMKSGML